MFVRTFLAAALILLLPLAAEAQTLPQGPGVVSSFCLSGGAWAPCANGSNTAAGTGGGYSVPALGGTPTIIAAAGVIKSSFSLENSTGSPVFWSITAAPGSLNDLTADGIIAVGATVSSGPTTPLGGTLQILSTTATACTVGATTPCVFAIVQ